MGEERKQQILEAIQAELASNGGNVDPAMLAAAIDRALGADTLEAGRNPDAARSALHGAETAGSSPKGAYARADEGKTPEELDTGNDDGQG
jgi:hypothetical protein